MRSRGLLMILMALVVPAWGDSCFLKRIEALDQSTVQPGCEVLTQQEQMQLMACLIYVKGGVIKTDKPLTFPIPLKQAREVCAGYGGSSTIIINKPGPYSEGLDRALLQKMSDDQIKQLNSCVEQRRCSGMSFTSAFSKGVAYDLAVQYAACVAQEACSSSAFEFLIDQTGDFAEAIQYSRCVAGNQCSSSSFEWAVAKRFPFAQALNYSQCVRGNHCSSSAFQWLMDNGGSYDQALKYSQCVHGGKCSSSAFEWKTAADKALKFDEAMELSQCVSENQCSLSQYQKVYELRNGTHFQAMLISRK